MPTRGGSHPQKRDFAVLTSVRTLYRRDWSLDTSDRRGPALASSESCAYLLPCLNINLFQDTKDGLGRVHRTFLFPFLMWPHWINSLFLVFVFNCIFNWTVEVGGRTWLLRDCQGPGSHPNSGSRTDFNLPLHFCVGLSRPLPIVPAGNQSDHLPHQREDPVPEV